MKITDHETAYLHALILAINAPNEEKSLETSPRAPTLKLPSQHAPIFEIAHQHAPIFEIAHQQPAPRSEFAGGDSANECRQAEVLPEDG